MKSFGLAGWSGSGKTTLVVRLIPALIARGITVSTMKHTHHNVDIDRPGKDSYEHREAGAYEVVITGTNRWALLHENRDEAEPTMDELLSRMAPVDLVIIEGFKTWRHEKLEVHRTDLGKPLLAADDPSIVAVASSEPLDGLNRPNFDLNDVDAIADFVINHLNLAPESRHGAA